MKNVQGYVVALAALVAGGCADIGIEQGSQRTPAAGVSNLKAGDAGPVLAQCSHNAGYQRSDNCCILPGYVSSLDVDAAFSRAMREYQFPAKAYVKGQSPDRIYRFHSVRGQYHSAANDVRPQGDRALGNGFWLFLTLERETDSTSSVAAAYCETPGLRPENAAAWHSAVQQSIRTTLPPK